MTLLAGASGAFSFEPLPGSSFVTVSRFFGAEYDANLGDFRVQNVSSTGTFRFTFTIPPDFVSLVSLNMVCVPTVGAAGPGRDIDLDSDYGAIGELYNTHSQSDVGTVYDLTGTANILTLINIAPVFTSISAGDYCGVFVDHNSIGGTIAYLGVLLEYQRLS